MLAVAQPDAVLMQQQGKLHKMSMGMSSSVSSPGADYAALLCNDA